MDQILTPAALQAADRLAEERYGMPSLLLMENAGRCVIDAIERAFGAVAGRRILVVCGKGNNGGDGFAAARHALQRGAMVTVVMMEPENRLSADALVMARILKKDPVPGLTVAPSFSTARLRRNDYAFILDAVFGTSYRGAVKGKYRTAISWMNRNSAIRIAVDVPSGLDALTGTVETTAVRAGLTVSFAALKPGFFFGCGREYAGTVIVADISMPNGAIGDCSSHIHLVTETDVRRGLPVRPRTAHKYSIGKVCVIGGSRGFTGAPLLSASAAMRSGAGAVILCVPETEFSAVSRRTLEVMPFPAPATADGSFALGAAFDIAEKAEWADAVLIGPGIASREQTNILVRGVIASTRRTMIIDAGGLTALAGSLGVLAERKKYPTVLTPHIGEFSRLLGIPSAEIERNKIEIARSFASAHGVVLVLKGAPTIVAAPGGEVYVNATGNPGMATAGSGDVLAGVIASLCAQGGDAVAAARNGVFLHGRAGDLAAGGKTEQGMIASDIVDYLPPAFASCTG